MIFNMSWTLEDAKHEVELHEHRYERAAGARDVAESLRWVIGLLSAALAFQMQLEWWVIIAIGVAAVYFSAVEYKVEEERARKDLIVWKDRVRNFGQADDGVVDTSESAD